MLTGMELAVVQRWPTETVRASLAAMFGFSSLIAVVLYASTGLYTRDTLVNMAMLLPGQSRLMTQHTNRAGLAVQVVVAVPPSVLDAR